MADHRWWCKSTRACVKLTEEQEKDLDDMAKQFEKTKGAS